MNENSPVPSEARWPETAPAPVSLSGKAAELRLLILETALLAGKGHVPPAYSCLDILVALYQGGILRVRPAEPQWPARDRFLLSKGHACLALYAVLADLGFFPRAELRSFCGPGALLPGHPDPLVPGAEILSGSLGHGLGIGAGLALAHRLSANEEPNVFVLLGDAECQEGSIWEAAMFASHHRLDRLVAIIDRNNLGATDFTENFLSLDPLAERWQAFGWEVQSVDGHSYPELDQALRRAARPHERSSRRPLALIAHTTKGKGVSFMENSPQWHHALPKGSAIETALRELRNALPGGRLAH